MLIAKVAREDTLVLRDRSGLVALVAEQRSARVVLDAKTLAVTSHWLAPVSPRSVQSSVQQMRKGEDERDSARESMFVRVDKVARCSHSNCKIRQCQSRARRCAYPL